MFLGLLHYCSRINTLILDLTEMILEKSSPKVQGVGDYVVLFIEMNDKY